jgi:UrcA family protein
MKALVLCGALIVLPAPALADVRPVANLLDAFETTVKLADLNLNSVSGAAVALDRIRLAARQVCGAPPNPNETVRLQRHRACVAAAVDDAVDALDAPLVTARHNRPNTARMASR